MPKVDIPIANGFYESDSLPLSHQQCVNWYTNIPQNRALSLENLFGTPGLSQIAIVGDENDVAYANRGAHVKNGLPYFVNGNGLYVLLRTVDEDYNESFELVFLGTVEGVSRVSMADNGTQLMILVPGGKGYIYNENDAIPFQEITDSDFTANGAPQYVKFIDSYFACSTDSKKWIISAINDGYSWNALDFGTAESDPDVIVSPAVHNNRLFITGSETTEAFQNVPNGAGFPFIRSNIFSDVGCFAPLSLISAHNTFMMIGGGKNQSPAIWLWEGGFVKRSTTAIDSILSKQTDVDIQNAFSFAYADKGAYFIGFTFGDYTFVYDVVTKRWHERSSFVNENVERWRINSLVTAYGHVLVGDFKDGRIGILDKEVYKEYDNNIHRIISTQPFSKRGNVIKVPMIEITIESGVGNDDESDPQISMDVSRDGKTWDYERLRSMGKIGEFNKRAIWYRNGKFPRLAVFRWKMSDPVKPVIIKAEAVVI